MITRAKNWPYFVAIAIIFLAGFFLRLHVPNIHRNLIAGDETTYHYAALDILKYGTLTREITGEMYRGEKVVEPSSWMSPGYPLFLAGVYGLGGTPQAVFVLQIAFSICSLAMIFYLLILLEIRKAAIVMALAVAAVYPGFIYNIDRLLTEHVFVFVFLAYAVFMVRSIKYHRFIDILSAGTWLVLAIQVRSHAAPFVPISLVLIILSEKDGGEKLKRCAMFLIPIGILMLPWWIRNLVTFDRFILLSEGGTGAKTWGDTPYFIDMSSTAGKTLQQVLHINRSADSSVFYRWRVFGFIQYMWGDVWDEWLVHPNRLLRPFLVLQPAVIVPSIMAMPLLIRRGSWELLFVCSIPICFTLMNMPFHGLPRYVYPSIPFVFLIFGALIDRFLNRSKEALNVTSDVPSSLLASHLGRAIRWSAILVASVISLVIGYSVYVFSMQENMEMSRYRLARYMGVRDLPSKKDLLLSQAFSSSNFVIENTRSKSCGLSICYKNNGVAPSILRLNVQEAITDQPVITKVTIKSNGGYIFDYTTIYWTSDKIPGWSEDHVYRFPTSSWTTSKAVYIDSNVSSLLIVPYIFRGDSFVVSEIKVEKFLARKMTE